MRFKTPRQQSDFNELPVHNVKLKRVLEILDQFCSMEFGKDICLTDVYRTKAEFDALYAATPADKRPKTSPHCYWRAADIRSTDFTDAQIKKMLTFLNCFTYTSGQGKPVAIYHVINGNTFHTHIQVD
jgi:hypothetical protein